MAFTGDLEHLPIVDVIQLLNATRKSGVLTVTGRKGESRLVFRDGFIVSASHLNNSVRIGEVLLERGAVTEEALAKALEEQNRAGSERAPLIVTLLDLELVEENQAYQGLQALIEMTIVELLTWKKGTFTLEPNPDEAADGYQFCPGGFTREINVDAQGVLMDALRVFDEKVRDGELAVEDENEPDPQITAEDLGLADLDQLEPQIPGVFQSLDDRWATASGDSEPGTASNPVRRLNDLIGTLAGLRTAPEVARAQLEYLASIFPRTLTLVVRDGKLSGEKGIGIRGEGCVSFGGLQLPLSDSPVLHQAVASGRPFWGAGDDAGLKDGLFAEIGTPATARFLLLPVQAFGKTVFVSYADFGDRPAQEVSMELLEMLAAQSGAALEKIHQRRRRPAKPPR